MELLAKIQQHLSVPKTHVNAFANYKYRNAEDILEAVKPLLGEAVLTLSDEVVCIGDRYYVKATALFAEPLSAEQKKIPISNGKLYMETVVTAYAREPLEKKGSDASQITGAASSYARKYALNGLFCIDDTKDADGEDNSQTHAPKAAVKPPNPVANHMDKVTAQKKEIQKLCDDMSKVPLLNKADYEKYILGATGLKFGSDSNEEIIKRLTAIK